MSNIKKGQLVLVGKSKKQYTFNVYPIGEECKDESGIYVFSKQVPTPPAGFTHTLIHIGMAESFQKRFY
ncbi:hypothetical protein, partial [Staphylococcus aureus]|uniref:hypothetical protein n=1 Tax=Staphylococcus aureus TaxID=1280 RepID=UPI001F37BF95